MARTTHIREHDTDRWHLADGADWPNPVCGFTIPGSPLVIRDGQLIPEGLNVCPACEEIGVRPPPDPREPVKGYVYQPLLGGDTETVLAVEPYIYNDPADMAVTSISSRLGAEPVMRRQDNWIAWVDANRVRVVKAGGA